MAMDDDKIEDAIKRAVASQAKKTANISWKFVEYDEIVDSRVDEVAVVGLFADEKEVNEIFSDVAVTLKSVDVAKKFVEGDKIAVKSTIEGKITSNHFEEGDNNVAANNDDCKFGTATVGSDVAIENKFDGVIDANDDEYKFEIATKGSDVTTKFDKEVAGKEENIGSKAPPYTPVRHDSEAVPENSGDAGTVDEERKKKKYGLINFNRGTETFVALFSIDALFKDGYVFRRDSKTLPPAYLNAYKNPNLDFGVEINGDHFEINLIDMFPKIKALTQKLTITSGVRWHVNNHGFPQEGKYFSTFSL